MLTVRPRCGPVKAMARPAGRRTTSADRRASFGAITLVTVTSSQDATDTELVAHRRYEPVAEVDFEQIL